MKRNLSLSFIAAGILFCGSAFSAIVGNPVNFPDEGRFAAGFQYWNLDNKDTVEFDDQINSELSSDGYALMISYGMSEILALDLRLGGASFELPTGLTEYDTGFAWGLGVRAMIYQNEKGLMVMGGAQYNNYSPEGGLTNSGLLFDAEPTDFSVSLDVSQKFADRFTVYGGLMHSDFTFTYYHVSSLGQREGGYEQDKEFGIYGGVNVEIYEGLSAFAEAHFVNEEAYMAGISYKIPFGPLSMGGNDHDYVPVTSGVYSSGVKTPAAPPDAVTQYVEGKLHAGIEISRFTDMKMTEENGIVPEYPNYRMSSDRVLLIATYDVMPWISVIGKLGMADLETHSSEGETTEFSSEIAAGIGVRAKLMELENGINICGEASVFRYEPEDEDTVSVAKERVSTPGDISIEWTEWTLGFDAEKNIGDTDLFAGVRFTSISADQERALDDGSVAASEFDLDDQIGLYAGARQHISDSFSLEFRASFIDAVGYSIGGVFNF